MEFPNIVTSIVDQKPANAFVPESKRQSSRTAVLVGEVEAIVVIAHVRNAIAIINAGIIERIVYRKATGVVVHDVKDHGDTVDVAKIDHRFKLRWPRCDVCERKGSKALCSQ